MANDSYLHSKNKTIKDEEARLRFQADISEAFLWKNIQSYIHSDTPQTVLEVGCGVSAQTEHLMSRLNANSNIYAIDIDKKYLDLAIEFSVNSPLLNGRVSYLCDDIRNITFPNEFFDGIYVSWVLEHLLSNELPNAFNEIYRILKPGGWLIINEIFMSPGDGVVGYGSGQKVPSILYSYVDALSCVQKKLGGDPFLGYISNLKKAINLNPNFIIKQLWQVPMEYEKTHPEFILSIRDGINLFTSLKKELVKTNIVLKGSLDDLYNEMKELDYIAWHFGQALVERPKSKRGKMYD